MLKKYHQLLDKLEAFVICEPKTWELYFKDKNLPFPVKYFNPLHRDSSAFINHIVKMDQMSFGENAMAMDKWVLFDCAMIPGFVFGFATRASNLSLADQSKCKASEGEFFPLSMYIAIPNADKSSWFGHNLCSLNGQLEEDLKGLGLMTKAYALKLFNISQLKGATQWNSQALYLHLRFGALHILSALTPNHSKEKTLCYSCQVLEPLSVLEGNVDAYQNKDYLTLELSKNNLIDLQKKLERGGQYYLLAKKGQDLYICDSP